MSDQSELAVRLDVGYVLREGLGFRVKPPLPKQGFSNSCQESYRRSFDKVLGSGCGLAQCSSNDGIGLNVLFLPVFIMSAWFRVSGALYTRGRSSEPRPPTPKTLNHATPKPPSPELLGRGGPRLQREFCKSGVWFELLSVHCIINDPRDPQALDPD